MSASSIALGPCEQQAEGHGKPLWQPRSATIGLLAAMRRAFCSRKASTNSRATSDKGRGAQLVLLKMDIEALLQNHTAFMKYRVLGLIRASLPTGCRLLQA